MGEQHTQRATGKLEQLAEQKFGQASLTWSERQLMSVASNSPPESYWAQCGPSFNDNDNDPSKAEKSCTNPGWGRKREIRAEVIRWLCVDEKAKHEVDPRGIRVYGAKITGRLDLRSVSIPFPIYLEHCCLMKDVDLRDAQLPLLSLDGCWVPPISADRLDVKGSVFLRYGFHGAEVSLNGAQIGGNLECGGAKFINHMNIALNGEGLNVRGDVFLTNGYHAEGEVRLLGAQIGGNLQCDGGTLINPTGRALDAGHINVQGSVFLRKGFRAEGEVALLGAQVGANVECDGGTFANPTGKALNADSIKVHGNVFLRNEFQAKGEVWLLGAKIGGDLECNNSTFTKLTAVSASVRTNFSWRALKDAEHAALDLRNASVDSIADDEKSWPAHGNLFLDDFVYGRVTTGPKDAKARLRWLARQYPLDGPDRKYPFAPQPYLQLAKVLREGGDDAGARAVLVAMEDQQRRGDILRPFLKWSIGYGQHPLWAGWWALGFGALGWILYRRSYLAGGMVPTEKDACGEFRPNGQIPKCYGRFFPSIYSLENSLPLVKLGQADKWQPDPDYIKNVGREESWPAWLRWLEGGLIRVGLLAPVNARASASRKGIWIKCAGREKSWPGWLQWLERGLIFVGLVAPVDPEEAPSRFSRFATSPRFLRWFLWFQILLGWLLATLFLAGVTGIVRKD